MKPFILNGYIFIVHYYERVDEAVVYGVFKNHLSDFELFIDRVVDYLRKVSSDK